MKQSLLKKILLYFSAVLLLFSLLMGIVFSLLFARHSQEIHQEEMQKRALALAAAIPAMEEATKILQAEDEAYTDTSSPTELLPGRGRGHHGRMMMHQGQGWCRRQYNEPNNNATAFFQQLNELGEGEVWLVSAGSRMIRSYGAENKDVLTDLSPEAEELIAEVLQGQAVHSRAFSPLLGTPSITVAAPIYQNGRISGAVLLHHSLKNMENSQWQGIRLLGISLLLALLLTAVLAAILARHFTRPLLKMQQTARAFASGDLTARTGIRQQDEIGQLAADLDTLGSELEQSRTERQDFLTAISHELRTPLTVLRGTLELLWQDLTSTPEQKSRCQEQAMSSLASLERLVGDLLELTRLQNPGFTLQKETLDVTEAFQDAVRQMQIMAAAKHIKIVTDFHQPQIIEGDYGRLRQLLVILLDNAIKFSPEETSITVAQEITPQGWQFSVTDQGCGIPLEELPHIFNKFRSSRGQANRQGTGLGLAIAQEIAQRHGLQLTCESKLGQGSKFIIIAE
ncbi:sensor histidine kinase [Selenomonas ruminantium]|uniref:histidine kinase n=1 Tax=Selenomonas ruminantium TaxID=971 RepID=A0A1K1PHM8_SELRU|nr:HAMP domain-containing sensor histidine kinase [Selenomonas ruminantium]SFW47306.1 Signal transduction histidine kinase [Selenomonas ruminantium]